MRNFVIGLLLLVSAAASAQPWQWEQYAGDYYNPTGFCEPTSLIFSLPEVGDFDGDGRDDYYNATPDGFVIGLRDTDRFHWTGVTGSQPLSALASFAMNLDGDAADELISFNLPVVAWKVISASPWRWQQRDDLLNGLFFPGGTVKAVLGDFDGDGNLNSVCWTRRFGPQGTVDTVRFYTRQLDSTWQAGAVFYPGGEILDHVVNIVSGDFDHDGDQDFGIMTEPPADPPVLWGCYFENTGSGIAPGGGSVYMCAGGDLDGDGGWDGLSQEFFRLRYSMIHTAPDSSFFHVTDTYYLGRFEGRVFGNLNVSGQSVVAGVYNHTEEVLPGWPTYSFWVESRSLMGWIRVQCEFSSDFGYQCFSTCLADLDGDGRKDMLNRISGTVGGTSWQTRRNTGSDSTDRFTFATALPASIPSSRVTVQIGDITGDGRAELGLLTPAPGESFQILFYGMIGDIADTNFILHTEWSNGLPSALNFRLADIDGDGICEAMLYSGSSWESYFFRHGHWDLYTGILPPVTASDISFADADNDGDLDLFTPDEVWLNLSPDAVDRNFILHPSSLILSAFPNPFNARTEIRFALPRAGEVSLDLFDITGRKVTTLFNHVATGGEHAVPLDATGLASGVYFVSLEAAGQIATHKVLLLK